MTVGERLKELRKSRRLSQAEVAKGINCSTVTYSRYENDKREPSMSTLGRLADFFGVSMDYIYGKSPMTEPALSSYEIDLIHTLRSFPRSVQDDIADYLALKMNKKEALKQ